MNTQTISQHLNSNTMCISIKFLLVSGSIIVKVKKMCIPMCKASKNEVSSSMILFSDDFHNNLITY